MTKNAMSREKVFSILKDKGAVKAEVYFSGGNDEGGVNQIVLFDADGNKIETMHEYYSSTEWDPATNSWKPTKPPTDDDKLSEALCAPVYDRYHSFAGDFYVNGTVTWDVVTGKVRNSGVEEVAHDEEFDDYI